jgi:hypothetical protein
MISPLIHWTHNTNKSIKMFTASGRAVLLCAARGARATPFDGLKHRARIFLERRRAPKINRV